MGSRRRTPHAARLAWLPILLLALNACAVSQASPTSSPSAAPPVADAFPVTVTDDAGREVTLEVAP